MLIDISMLILICFRSRIKELVGSCKFVFFRAVGKSYIKALWVLLRLLSSGVYLWWCLYTTEVAIVAVLWGFLVGFFIYKDLKLKDIPKFI